MRAAANSRHNDNDNQKMGCRKSKPLQIKKKGFSFPIPEIARRIGDRCLDLNENGRNEIRLTFAAKPDTRPTLSQFKSLKIPRSTNFTVFRNVDRWILKLLNCENVRRADDVF